MDMPEHKTPKQIIARLAEALVVILVGFGLFIWSSSRAALDPEIDFKPMEITDSKFYFLTVYQILTLTFLYAFLRWRKWTIRNFNLQFHVKMVLVALVLIICRESLGYAILFLLTKLEIIGALPPREAVFNAGLLSTFLVVIINSFYEELLLVGYLFKRMENLPAVVVLFVSFVVRASYHTYQGMEQLPFLFSIALAFGFYYLKYKKLWPLVIAHGLSNTFSFIHVKFGWFDM